MIHQSDKLLLIAGPCSLENENVCRPVAQTLVKLRDQNDDVRIVFKGSYDKANRTSFGGKRGPGLEAGLALLDLIRRDYGLPVLTDIHTPEQAAVVGAVVDVLQIPAFLCRQTDLLTAAAKTGKAINVKKGQFLSPMEMRYVVGKLEASGAREIWQTERGTTFGYQNLVVDMRAFPIMKTFGHPVIFDATHSVQLPGAADGASGGQREYVPTLAHAALAAGADGLFFETHPDPIHALSDAANQIPTAQFPSVVADCLKLWRVMRTL